MDRRRGTPWRVALVTAALLPLIALQSPTASATTLFSDGFESGDLSSWTSSQGVQVQSTIRFAGAFAARATTTAASAYAQEQLAAPQAELYMDARIHVVSVVGTTTLLRFKTSTDNKVLSVNVKSSGTLQIKNHNTGVALSSTTVMSFGTWHEVQLHGLVNGAAGLAEVWLDGAPVADISGTQDLGTSTMARIEIASNQSSSGFDVVFDDVIVDTAFIGGGGDPPGTIVMAAGDIACDPADPDFNNGNGTSSHCRQGFTADLLAEADAVVAVGDTQYDCGGADAYGASYDPSWGQYRSITYPTVGDEEYEGPPGTDCGAAGADGYFGYFGAAAHPESDGYYSFDLGGWHVVVLNSECGQVGGCGEGSAQNDWLETDLATTTEACTLATLHRPRFASKKTGAQVNANMKPFWDDLYAAGADVILGGNSHFYERFEKQDPAGGPAADGLVQWVVGTGGKSHGGLATPANRLPTSETGTPKTFGVLKLTLHPTSYDWEFVVEGSFAFTDTGTASCV